MAHQQYESCIDACNACANACDHCAASCLQEPDVKAMARCIALDMDCADICRIAAAYMSRGSDMSSASYVSTFARLAGTNAQSII